MDHYESFATKAYVIGEILISIMALAGAGYILSASISPGSVALASSLATSVTVFWFSRRATEQSTNKIQEISDGNLKALNARIDMLMSQQLPVPTVQPPAHEATL